MRRHSQFVLQRMKQLEMEFKYLELLSDEEKEYLHNEQISVKLVHHLSLTPDLPGDPRLLCS